MKTVAIYNYKGGVGKTTLATHLAYRAEAQGISTVAISLNRYGDLLPRLARERRSTQEVPHVEHRGHLTIIHSPGAVPQVPDAALVIYDCSPDLDSALGVKPDLLLFPTNLSPMNLSPLPGCLADLASSCGSIQFIPWMLRTNGDVAALRDVVGRFPNMKVSDHVVPESPAIFRAEEDLRAVWDSPADADSLGAQALARLCDDIIALLGVAPVH